MRDDDRFTIADILIICFAGMLLLTLFGCATPPAQSDADAFEDLRLEHQRLGREYDLLELRYAVRRVCRRVTAHEDWPDCDDRAGL